MAKNDQINITLSKSALLARAKELRQQANDAIGLAVRLEEWAQKGKAAEPEAKAKGKKTKGSKGKPAKAPEPEVTTPEGGYSPDDLKGMARKELAAVYKALGGDPKGLLMPDLRTRIMEAQESGGYERSDAEECDITGEEGPTWSVEHDGETWSVGADIIEALKDGHAMADLIENGGV